MAIDADARATLEEQVKRLQEDVRRLQADVRRLGRHGEMHRAGGEDEVRFIRSLRSGAAADRPTQSQVGDCYWASDTNVLSIWNSAGAWVSETLT